MRKNPPTIVYQRSGFPPRPRPGQFIHIDDAGTFVWSDGRWRGVDGDLEVVAAVANDVAPRNAVVIVEDTVVLCDRSAHGRVDGLCQAVVGDSAVVRVDGRMGGFHDLVAMQRVIVDGAPGNLDQLPIAPGVSIIVVGVALSATEIFVRPEKKIGTTT